MIKKVILLGCCCVFSLFMPTQAWGASQTLNTTMKSVSGLDSYSGVWNASNSSANSYYGSPATNGSAYSSPVQYGMIARPAQLAITADQFATNHRLGFTSVPLLGIVPLDDEPTGVDEEQSPVGDGLTVLLLCCLGYVWVRKRAKCAN